MKTRSNRSSLKKGAMGLLLTSVVATGAVASTSASSTPGGGGGTLTIAMTLSDIPGTDTIMAFNQAGEGLRFVGLQVYEGLTGFDLSQTDIPAPLTGALAEDWSVSDDGRIHTFHLREGVTFHDGTPWNADAAIFNFDRYKNPESEYSDDTLRAQSGLFTRSIESYRKVDDMTIELTTANPYVFLPNDLALLPMGSPESIIAGDEMVDGTGPFMYESLEAGQSLVLTRFADYWRGAAKLDTVVLRPIPEPVARIAALRAGEVNWVEYANPDDVPQLRDEGYNVVTNSYSQVWRCTVDTTKPPWDDVRVRQAAALAINREQLADTLLAGTATAANQTATPADEGYDPSYAPFAYNPDEARALIEEAGVDGFSATLSVPTSGSGNMVPTSMAEKVQADLAEIGIDVELIPLEWTTVLADNNAGNMPGGADLSCWASTFLLPGLWNAWFNSASPVNIGGYSNPDVDTLLADAATIVDDAARTEIFKQINVAISEDVPWIPIVNDQNPRALAPDVTGFVNPQSWFVDLRTIEIG